MNVLVVSQKSDILMAISVFTLCLLLFATARANYGAFMPNLRSIEINQFEETPIDDEPLPNYESSFDDGLLADDACKVCLEFKKELFKSGMRRILSNDCKMLPTSNQRFCRRFVAVIWRRTNKQPEICKRLGFCQMRNVEVEDSIMMGQYENKSVIPDAHTCEVCTKIVDVMQGENLQVQLKKKCDIWGQIQQKPCKNLYDVLFKSIKDISGKTACEKANFCVKKVRNEYNGINILDEGLSDKGSIDEGSSDEGFSDVGLSDEGLRYVGFEIDFGLQTDDSSSSQSCDACRSFYESVKKTDIKEILGYACHTLPEKARTYCEDLEYAIDQMSSTGTVFCKRFGFCSVSAELNDLSVNSNDDQDFANEGYTNAKTCQDCDNMVKVMMDKDVQENMIKHCRYYKYESSCYAFYETLFASIETNAPEKPCEKAQICDTNTLGTALSADAQNFGVCTICKIIIRLAEDKERQTMIQENIDEVCRHLPSPMNIMAKLVLDNFLERLFQMINSETTQQFCAGIRMCVSDSTVEIDLNDNIESLALGGGCKMCHTLVTDMQKKDKQDALQKVVEMAFDLIPQPYDVMAKSMLMGYLHNFFEIISSGSPDHICAKYLKCLEFANYYGAFADDQSIEMNPEPLYMYMLPDDVYSDGTTTNKTCEACYSFYDAIKTPGIKAKLANDCHKMPVKTRRYCKKLINLAFNPGSTKAGTCLGLGLCPTLKGFVSESQSDAQVCQSCVKLISILEEQKIQDTLSQKCKNHQYVQSCNAFYRMLFRYIETVSPKQSCEKAGLCGKEQLANRMSGTVKNTGICTICNYLVRIANGQEIQKEILNGPLEQLLKVANRNSLKQLKHICTNTNFCDDDEIGANVDEDLEHERVCKICQLLVVDMQRKDKQNVVNKVVEMAFDHIPQPYEGMAKSLVMGHLQRFFEVIISERLAHICAKFLKCSDSDTTITNTNVVSTPILDQSLEINLYEESQVNDESLPYNDSGIKVESAFAADACATCLSFYNELEKPGMKLTLMSDCKMLPMANQKFCRRLVDSIRNRKVYPKTAICKALGFCTDKSKEETLDVTDIDSGSKRRKDAIPDAQTCEACAHLVDAMRDEKLQNTMKSKCQHWVKRNRTTCTLFYDVLFESIKPMPARVACEKAKFCVKKGDIEYNSLKVDLSVEDGEIKIKESLTDGTAADNSCDACELFYDSVQTPELKLLLRSYCDALPSNCRKYCQVLFKFVFKSDRTKTDICKRIGLCPALTEINDARTGLNDLDDFINGEKNDTQVCEACVDLMNAVKDEKVQRNVILQCKVHKHSQSCNAFYRTIFKFTETATAKQSCIKAKLCDSEWTENKLLAGLTRGDVVDSEACAICNYIVESASNQDTQTMIRDAIKELCDQLPSPVKTMVEQFLDDSLERLLKMVHSMATEHFCESISFCVGDAIDILDLSYDLELAGGCKLCHSMVTDIQRRDTQDALKKVVEKVFELIPQAYDVIAESLVMDLLQNFFKFISAGTSETICGKYLKCLTIIGQ